MPRPLIIKIDDHKPQPNKKATGSISTHLLRENEISLYGSSNQNMSNYVFTADNEQIDAIEETGSKSLVRNLISKYESSASVTRSTLIKQKSKSLSDLVQPQQFSISRRVQDNFASQYNIRDSREQVFNFKKVLSKFETDKTKISFNKTTVYRHKDNSSNFNNFNDIKETSKELLQSLYKSLNDSEFLIKWQDEVVQFLQKLSNLPVYISEKREILGQSGDNQKKNEKDIFQFNNKEAEALKNVKSLGNSEFNHSLKVKEARNIFEARVTSTQTHSNTKNISRSVSEYFTGKSTDDKISYSKESYGRQQSEFPHYSNFTVESDEGENDNNQEHISYEEHHVETQAIPVSSMKIQKLKSLFEPKNGSTKHDPYEELLAENINQNGPEAFFGSTLEDRLIPPAKVVTLTEDEGEEDGEDHLENSKQQIEQLINEIEENEGRIENLTQKDKDEGSYINEVLIKILIKLDDVKTYGNGVIQSERRKAIQFVQNSIKNLRAKMRGY